MTISECISIVREEMLEACLDERLPKLYEFIANESNGTLPLHMSDLPSLSTSSSWSSFLSLSTSSHSLNKVLPELEQEQEETAEIAPSVGNPKVAVSEDDDHVMVGPPKGRRCNLAKGYERYHPERYRCTGYETKDYKWFDGIADAKDQRFTIDLLNGSMDTLPDVRPFLYYIGYFAGDRYRLPRNPSRHLPSIIEDIFVRAGRWYLLGEWHKGSGYFLNERDWSWLNKGKSMTMPYEFFCEGLSGPLRGDVGFEFTKVRMAKERDEFDFVEDVLKSNARVPLPSKTVTDVFPGHADWDGFIQHLYGLHHPIRLMMLGYSVKSVHHARVRGDWSFVKSEAVKHYPFDPKCKVEKTVSCYLQ